MNRQFRVYPLILVYILMQLISLVYWDPGGAHSDPARSIASVRYICSHFQPKRSSDVLNNAA